MSCFLPLFLLLLYIIFSSFFLFLLLYKWLSYIFKPNEESNNVAFWVTVPYILVNGYRRELHAEDEDSMNLRSTGNHVAPLYNRNLNPQKNKAAKSVSGGKYSRKMTAGLKPCNSALLERPEFPYVVNKFLTRNFVTVSQLFGSCLCAEPRVSHS